MPLKSRFTLPLIATLLLFVLAACGGGDETNTEPPIAKSVPDTSAPTLSGSPSAEYPEFDVAQTSDEESFTKPTPPGGIIPTAPPPPESSFDSDGDGFYTMDELMLALEASISDYVWPEDYVFSVEKAHHNITRDVPDYAGFENGAEYTIIGFPHMCAWAETWLVANWAGDAELQETAMTQLQEESLNNPSFIFITDQLQELFQKAELGDIAPLQQFIDNNCAWNSFESTPEASAPVRFASKDIITL